MGRRCLEKADELGFSFFFSYKDLFYSLNKVYENKLYDPSRGT